MVSIFYNNVINNILDTTSMDHPEVNPGTQHQFNIGTGGLYNSTSLLGSLDNIRLYNRLTTDEEDTILYNELV